MTTNEFDNQSDISILDRTIFEECAEKYGTPYYLYDADIVAQQSAAVRSAFQDMCNVYFAVKANPNLQLLKAIRTDVQGLDVSSIGELEQALLAGYEPRTLSFAGPAKTVDELRPAIEYGVGSISVESERELRDIFRVAQDVGRVANILLRVNPKSDPRAYGLKMGGRPIQFGIDEEHLERVAKTIANHKSEVYLRGLHIYAGSQGFDYSAIASGIRNTLETAEKVELLTGSPISKLNMGGGFGISHTASGKQLDLDALANELNPSFEQFLSSGGRSCDLIFELGRYLVADAGIYVARVIGTKESRGQFFAITDGGLHHHLAAAGNFGVGFRSNFEVVNLTNPTEPKIECNIAGPSCNPTDLLGHKILVAKLREGDLVAVLSSGSYGLTASPVWFLGRPTPSEIIHKNGKVYLGRQSRTILDFN